MRAPGSGRPGRPMGGPAMSRRQAREEAAHRYADAGWHVFPAEPGGKRPATEHGYLDATTSHKQIQNWWRAEPRSNLAVATGAPGPDVLDVDKHKEGDGFSAFSKLKQAGLVREPMAIVRTPSGGFHAYYKGTEHQRNGHIPGVYVDFRSRGGYVVAPPSRIAGREYEVARKQASADTFDWAAAKKLLDPQPERQPYRAPERAPGERADYTGMANWLASQAPDGRNRNEALFWASCRVVEAGDTDALSRLADAARATGLDEREIGRTIASAQQTAGRGGGQRSFEHLAARVPSAAAQPDLQAEAREAGALPTWPASGPILACHRLTGPRSHPIQRMEISCHLTPRPRRRPPPALTRRALRGRARPATPSLTSGTPSTT
jgi:Bifunctional DNA primase/polymerase, N-terminal